ncbi:GTPase-activating protein [Ascosphaera acerosa]|nr:GTPase-activating protein [Ascosphaera acerosa]
MTDDKGLEAATAVTAADPPAAPFGASQPPSAASWTEKTAAVDDKSAATPAKGPSTTTAGTDEAGGTTQKENSLEAKQASKEEELDAAIAHLPEDERQIIKDQLYSPPVNITYFQLYRFANKLDLFMLFISAVAAILGGVALPFMTILFGSMTGTFQKIFLGTISYDDFKHDLSKYSLYFVYLGIAEFVLVYISTLGWIYTGERIAQKVRQQYLEAILRQNMAYFDKLGAGEITTRITADMNLIQEGISEKVGLTLTAVASFIAAFIIGFIRYWKLTLILCSTLVAIVGGIGGGSTFIVAFSKKGIDAYGEGGTVAEEVISSIRNATAFGTQDKLAKKYEVHLEEARKWGRKTQMSIGAVWGGCMLIVELTYGLSLWEGSRLLVSGDTNLQQIMTIILAVLMGAFALGNVAPYGEAFTAAISAGSKIYSTIDRATPIDPTSTEGKRLDEVKGDIELRHVKHIYPCRPEVTVMDDVSLVAPAGKVTALVGPSGSGKSTIVGLLERFYNPVQGRVLLDGHDISQMNVSWLRQQISLVSQEPVLFGTTIYGNIRHGLIGSDVLERESADQIRQRIEDAAKLANAHDFITGLPEGYETNVGERGFLLSGGQKQRVAIARAIVSNPKILLLDEATSALDTKSEGVVQAALDAAAQGRTTIVIAHRLSTIKNAHNIIVLVGGKIVEQGTHDQLVSKGGTYASLVNSQRLNEEREAEALADHDVDEDGKGIDAQVAHSGSSGYEAAHDKVPLQRESTLTRNASTDIEKVATKESISQAILAKHGEEAEPKYSLTKLIRFISSFNRPETTLMILALLASIITGGATPTQSIFFSKAVSTLALPPEQYGKLRSDANFWAGMFMMLGFVEFIAILFSIGLLGVASEALIFRARSTAFRSMLRQDIAYFDREENSAGALTSFLSTETKSLSGISGATLGTIVKVLITLFASCIVALAFGWKLGLVCIAVVPAILACGFLRFYMLARFSARSKKAYQKSASYACEATSAIRTVAALTREEDVWRHYEDQLEAQAKDSLVSVLKASVLYAASQAIMFFCMALGFWYGGTLLGKGEYGFFQFFVCFSEVIFGAQAAGTIFAFAPDMGKAKAAAAVFKKLIDRKPRVDTWSEEGEKIDHVEGVIEFRNVHFRYPTRPEQPVLRGLNLTVQPGQYVALVGASGCGKSTTIALIERFYDVLSGAVLVDGKDISTLNVNSYREHISLVSQEPTLYQGTIRDNILLGVSRDDVSDAEIETVCRAANIYDFIISLPDGFATVVGSKGSMLSGGQKQRLAIARALIRNPKILLLDEATSALDSESEKIVQSALDAAAKGRTTIAVAHRLSTIQNADIIYVFDQGRIVESGTHQELLRIKGRYFELVTLQSLDKH